MPLTLLLTARLLTLRAYTVVVLTFGFGLQMGMVSEANAFEWGKNPKKHCLTGQSVDQRLDICIDADEFVSAPEYKLTLADDGFSVTFSGSFDFGATRDMSDLLASNPQIKQLNLVSDGGVIYEARGIARLIQQFGLATHVEKFCWSACTIAFSSATNRSVAGDGKLGFHQYLLQSQNNSSWIDPEQEQQRDLVFFEEQGVQPWFIKRVFSKTHKNIWIPTHTELLDGGVITSVQD